MPLSVSYRRNKEGKIYKKHRYYRHRKNWPNKTPLCKSVRADDLENRVLSTIGGLFHNQKKLEKAIKTAIGTVEPRKDDTKKRIAKIERELREHDQEMERVLDEILSSHGKNPTIRAKLDDRSDEIHSRIEELKAEQEKLRTQQRKLAIKIPEDLAERVRNLMFTLTYGAVQLFSDGRKSHSVS